METASREGCGKGLLLSEVYRIGLSSAGLLISNVDIDIDTIDDTFGVSISVSTILLCLGIESGIGDTFEACFCRYFDIDTFDVKFTLNSSLKHRS